MSIDDDVGEADVLLAKALAQAVREVGRNLATEPRRVQGMVSDVLGTESRSRRAEIDAVVIAAEESVPDDLLAERIDVPTALDRLRARGLDVAVAMFAIEVWRYALGMLEPDAQIPSLTNSTPSPTTPVAVAAATVDLAKPQAPPATAPPTVVEFPPPAAAAFALAPPPVAPAPAPARKRRRRLLLLIAVPVAVLAVVAGVVVATRDDTPAAQTDDSSSPDTDPPRTTTTTEVATSTTVVPESLVFDAEQTPVGDLTRTWSIDDSELEAVLSFTNTTDSDLTGTHYETIPKSLAATADLITATGATMVRDDPILSWTFTVPAGETVEYTYHLTLPADTTLETLEQRRDELLVDTAAFKAEREAPPLLEISTPDGTAVETPEADIIGTTDPSATVQVNGFQAVVNAEGTWVAHVTGLVEAANTMTATATSEWGVMTTRQSTVVYTATPTGSTTPGKGNGGPTDPNPGGGGNNNTTTTPPSTGGSTNTTASTAKTTTTPPTTQPQPPPPEPVVTLNAPPSVTACNAFQVTASVTGQWTSGSWTTSWGQGGGSTTLSASGRPDSTTAYSVTVKFTANGPGGSGFAERTIPVQPNPQSPGLDC